MEQRTRKLMKILNALHRRDDINRLGVKKKKRRNGH